MSTFTEIYTKKWNQVYRICFRKLCNPTLAEDATQETMYKLMKNFDKIDQKTLNAWLKRVAENTCIDILRKQQTENKTIAELSFSADTTGPELMKEAREISKSLAPKYREIFHLAFECGLHNREIADRLHIPLATVKSRVKICLEKLRSRLQQ